VFPNEILCGFLISPIHATHSVSSSFTGAKLPLLFSTVLKMEAARPFETSTCTYQTTTRYQNPAEQNIIVAIRPSNHKCCIYVSMLPERDCTGHVNLAPQMPNVAFEILLRILQVSLSNLVPDANKCWDSISKRPRPVPSTFYPITRVVTT